MAWPPLMMPRTSGRATGSGHDGYAHTPPLTGSSGTGAIKGQDELNHYYGMARGLTILTDWVPWN